MAQEPFAEDLNWFWKGWFYGNENIDLAVEDVSKKENGYMITLANKGGIPMPMKLNFTFEDGSTEKLNLPVEIWQRGDSWEYLLETPKKLEKVEFDKMKQVPDINSSNDVWSISN